MTGWGVERSTRPACPASAPPADVSALMPPPSQGAERRTERRAGRTGSRCAPRALVIGGPVGAAWLLTGAAAHAADRDPAADGSSVTGAIVDGDIASPPFIPVLHAAAQPRADRTAEPTVIAVLDAAAQPLGLDRTAVRVASSGTAAPARVLSRPAAVLSVIRDVAALPNA